MRFSFFLGQECNYPHLMKGLLKLFLIPSRSAYLGAEIIYKHLVFDIHN